MTKTTAYQLINKAVTKPHKLAVKTTLTYWQNISVKQTMNSNKYFTVINVPTCSKTKDLILPLYLHSARVRKKIQIEIYHQLKIRNLVLHIHSHILNVNTR